LDLILKDSSKDEDAQAYFYTQHPGNMNIVGPKSNYHIAIFNPTSIPCKQYRFQKQIQNKDGG